MPKKVSVTSGKDYSSYLEGYEECKGKSIANIEPGDSIRYMTNDMFRKGGAVRRNAYPDYIVCINIVNKASWCVQIKDPTLKVWVKSKATKQSERDEMNKVYALYKAGKLKASK